MNNNQIKKINKSELPEILNEYLVTFEESDKELKSKINDINKSIEDIRQEIKDNEVKLKNKVDEINSEKKKINIKLHGVSGDYDAEELILSAEQLKKLTEEKKIIEEEIKNKSTELTQKLSEKEDEKNTTYDLKTKVDSINSDVRKNLKETYDSFDKKLKAINSALEICDNDNLRKALEEEKENMKSGLEKIKMDGENLLKEEMGLDINEPEKNENNVIEIDNTEPIFTEVREEKIYNETDKPSKEITSDLSSISFEEKSEELPLPSINKEVVFDHEREVIAKVDASLKADLVKSSDVVNNNINKFFEMNNKKNIENGDDIYYIGAIVDSNKKVKTYNSINNYINGIANYPEEFISGEIKKIIGLNNKEVVSFDSKENKVISDIKRENKNITDLAMQVGDLFVKYDSSNYIVSDKLSDKKVMGL